MGGEIVNRVYLNYENSRKHDIDSFDYSLVLDRYIGNYS